MCATRSSTAVSDGTTRSREKRARVDASGTFCLSKCVRVMDTENHTMTPVIEQK